MAKNHKTLDDVLKRNYRSDETYEAQIKERQVTLMELQHALFHKGERLIVVMEGQDAAGKGGAIKRLTNLLDPRGFRVNAISAPSPEEQGIHYMYRFWRLLPKKGHIAIFDRSWYGRVLVERVEGFAEKEAWKRAYGEINDFEGLLADDGVMIVKIFLHVSKEEQARRFIERLTNPLKIWKMSPEDMRNRRRWDDYQVAISDMLAKTSTDEVPWHLIAADNKHYARAKVLKTVIDAMRQRLDPAQPYLDRAWQQEALTELGYQGQALTQMAPIPKSGNSSS